MSDQFFNQQFSPVDGRKEYAPSSGNRPRPPPPPARGGTAPSRRTNASGYYSSSSTQNTTGTTFNGGRSNIGGVSSSSGSATTMRRPTTGSYYTATNTNSNLNSATSTGAAPAFPAYNPYGSNAASGTNNSGMGMGMVGQSTAEKSNSMDQDDWFDQAQNQDDSNMGMNSNNTGTGMGSASASAAGQSSTNMPNVMNPYDFANTNNNNTNGLKSESMEMPSGSSSGNLNLSGAMNQTGSSSSRTFSSYDDEFADEPPLLEELGINIDHIKTKSLAVILPVKYAKTVIDTSIMEDNDLAGPIAFGLLLGTELLLAVEVRFGAIYGFGLFGCLATTLVLNLMSPSDSISIWTVVSILGYSLLPVNMLAFINIFYRIKKMGRLGFVLAAVTIAWCTVSSTRLIERGCGMRDQRYLIGYPNALLYSAFVIMTIF